MSRTATVILVVELAALLVGVAFAVELLQRRLGAERLRRWMGGRPITAALKGIALGFITPFCTYSASVGMSTVCAPATVTTYSTQLRLRYRDGSPRLRNSASALIAACACGGMFLR